MARKSIGRRDASRSLTKLQILVINGWGCGSRDSICALPVVLVSIRRPQSYSYIPDCVAETTTRRVNLYPMLLGIIMCVTRALGVGCADEWLNSESLMRSKRAAAAAIKDDVGVFFLFFFRWSRDNRPLPLARAFIFKRRRFSGVCFN